MSGMRSYMMNDSAKVVGKASSGYNDAGRRMVSEFSQIRVSVEGRMDWSNAPTILGAIAAGIAILGAIVVVVRYLLERRIGIKVPPRSSGQRDDSPFSVK